MATALHHLHNAQDIGGLKTDHSPVSDSVFDSVDTPLQECIGKSAKPYRLWEFQCHALYTLLLEKGLSKAAEVRKSIEQLPVQSFQAKSYYEKWAAALANVSIERGTIKQSELEAALGGTNDRPGIEFKTGDYVKVKPEDSTARYRKPHLRTPGYLFGVIGKISEVVGYLEEPDISAYPRADGPKQPVYRVTFSQTDVWEGYSGSAEDKIDIEIWQPWLEASDADKLNSQGSHCSALGNPARAHGHAHSHDHDSHEHHDHVHEERAQVEQKAVDDEGDDSNRSAFFNALLKVFIGKGIISTSELRQRVELLESYGSDPIGPKLVAKAWVDPAFRGRLLEDGMTAARELGFSAPGFPLKGGKQEASKELTGNLLVAVADSEKEYNLIVCTLCSCYPVAILGLAPSWYKSRAYRARSVRDPRAVLREFGTEVPESVSIIVRDSTADTRYIKVPLRPANTDGWTEEQLMSLITRDSLVGVSYPRQP